MSPEDFEDYYTKIKEVEQIIAYYIYIPKNQTDNLSFAKTFDSDKFISRVTSIVVFIIGIMAAIAIGLVIYVNKSNRKRD